MKQAIQALAEQQSGEVIDHIEAYGGARHNVTVGIKTADCPNGVGFTVQNGELKVEGDAWNQQQGFNRMRSLGTNMIKAYKVSQRTHMMNPMARTKVTSNQKQVIFEAVI